ncbi:hypothetical protein CLOSTMETH_00968 [[Clostridium] methylpentosum DSM 5476]|uniref:Uncharacterized protein n=1 Tax=[Clostridium] methylpentosum DSM 5476 TaxID=537013 RepID=C0EAV1_9FIRM|nr:hypothetical protein CLOSTMETH_00968 [[Clostridium] methylpentosum DSM 5476]
MSLAHAFINENKIRLVSASRIFRQIISKHSGILMGEKLFGRTKESFGKSFGMIFKWFLQ